MRSVLTFLLIVLFFFSYKANSDYAHVKTSEGVFLLNHKTNFNPGKDSLLKNKFLKKIISALSIKGNLRKKEALRIEKIVRTYFMKDSINLALLSQKLEGYTSLVRFDSLINVLKESKVSPDQLKLRIDSLIKNQGPDCPDCKTEISDKEMQELVDKLAPMISEKAKEEESNEQKQKKIRLIREILSSTKPIIDTLEINDSVSKRYRLTIKKHEVYGYHPSWMNKKYFNYNFSLISTLAYYGYELNGKTGGYVSTHGWDTAAVIQKAKKEDSKVHLVVYCSSRQDLQGFLKNSKAQQDFATTIIELLNKRSADGVNLMFENVGKDCRNRITKFVKTLSHDLKTANPKFELTLTLPCLDENDDYDVEALNESVNRFIIDFTKKNTHGPIVPLTGGDYSLESGIARYLSKKVPADKFIACMPYRGANWDFQSGSFIEYVPYDRILKSYQTEFGKFYDKTTNVRTDVVVDGDTLEQLWYDDEKTLSQKYNFILANKLSGVGVWALGDDDKRPELWDALLDKMVEFDSTDVVFIKKPRRDTVILGFWAQIKHELSLYKELFQHPCHFDDTGTKRQELKSDNIIGYVAAGFSILLTLTSAYSIIKRRALGDDWGKRKMFLIIQIILVVFVMTSLLMFAFLNPNFYHFGSRDKFSTDCETSFGTILEVLAIGFIIGLGAMKFLVMPLIKPKEVP